MTFVSTTIASNNQIGDKQPDLGLFVEDIENRLLSKWNFAQAKFHDERVFVRLFNDAVSESVENLDRAGDDLINFVLE